MIRKTISTILALLMVSPFSVMAKANDPLGAKAVTAASAKETLLRQSEPEARVVAANISKGKISIELTRELATESTIVVHVGMTDVSDGVSYVGTGGFRKGYYGQSGSYVTPGEYLTGTMEFVNDTGETYRITDYSFSDGWVYSIGRIYNDAAKSAGYTVNQTIALDDEAWYQLNYEYYQLGENAGNLNTLRNMFGHGAVGQGSRIATENHPVMKDLAQYYLFNQMQLTFDQNSYAVNSMTSKPNTPNITLWDYVTRTEQNESLVNEILAPKEIGEDGLILDIGANADNDKTGNAYNGAYADFGFALTLTRMGSLTVTYDSNESTSGDVPIDNQLYNENDTVTVKGNEGDLQKNGYIFEGWTLSADGSGTVYSENDAFAIGNEDVTLYAKWGKTGGDGGVVTSLYTVYYRDVDTNAEISSAKTATAYVGSVVAAVSEQLSIAGYSYIEASAESITISMYGENTMTLYYKKTLDSAINMHTAYVIGYPDETFRAENNITRAETTMIIYRLLEDEGKNGTVSDQFVDINEQWFTQAVNYLAHLEMLGGYDDNTFRPNSPVTRAEFAALIARFWGLDNHISDTFTDVPNEHWAAGYIGAVALKGWITGFADGTFRPEQGVTRAQAVTLVNHIQERKLRAEDVPTDILGLYRDTTKEYWAFSDIIEASMNHSYIKDEDMYETWHTYAKQ